MAPTLPDLEDLCNHGLTCDLCSLLPVERRGELFAFSPTHYPWIANVELEDVLN